MPKHYNPSILKSDFSTIMLFRCSPRNYAEEFVRGEIYWSTPQTWIDKEYEGETEQGDILEGTFASVIPLINPSLFERLKKYTATSSFRCKGYTFFRRNIVLDLPCLCLYGLHNSSFKNSEDGKGRLKRTAVIPKEYFLGFAGCKNKDEYNKLSVKDKAVVIMIHNTHEFFSRVIKALVSLGVNENDIIISPVNYVNKFQENVFMGHVPYELLNKDIKYESQSEVRIIINSKNRKLMDYLKKHNNHINIGSLDDIAEIYDYYFDDMQIELRGNKSIMFSLPNPEERDIDSFTFIELYTLLLNIVAYKTVNVLGINDDEKETDLNDRIKPILDVFSNKFNILVFVDKNRNISLSGLSKEYQEQFDEYHRKDIIVENYAKKLEDLLKNGGPDAVIAECEKQSIDEISSKVTFYYLGLSYNMLNRLDEAIEFFSKSYKSDYKPVESLSAISTILFLNSQFSEAIGVYRLMLYYECNSYDVWTNIGICYLNLNKLDEAVSCFSKSISIKPNMPAPYFNQGIAYLRKGNRNKAKELMYKSIVIDPENSFYKNEYIKSFGNQH